MPAGNFGKSIAFTTDKLMIEAYSISSTAGQVFMFDLNGNLKKDLKSPPDYDGFHPMLIKACCLVEPLVTCHYKDKSSAIPCPDVDNINRCRASFW